MSAPATPTGDRSRLADRCGRIARSRPFEIAIIVLIIANGVVLGIETYPHLGAAGPVLRALETLPDLIEQGDDLRAVLAELERELRIDRDDVLGRHPHRRPDRPDGH